jgi:hypothetical protein
MRIDMWVDDINKKEEYAIEVKLVGISKKGDLKKFDDDEYSSVEIDIAKLKKIIGKDPNKCLTIAVYDGSDVWSPREIEDKISQKMKKELSDDLRLLICSNGKCKYVGR